MKLKICGSGFTDLDDNNLNWHSNENSEVIQWLAEGNEPEPEFTEAELAQQVINAKVQEARVYLISTGWYIERLNDPSSGKAIPQEVLDKRAEARVLINELEG